MISLFRYRTATNPVPPPMANSMSKAATTPPIRKRIVKLLLENIDLPGSRKLRMCNPKVPDKSQNYMKAEIATL